ncbi:allophanate hydrolase subunit 1 [Mycobacterium sp. CBMA293]|uniref:5-oxoprolinase subunit B family protein n=1 Tax=unclassified Mycolicibacterium TaxID=2636767 RepID=UPI0012DBECF9|nr:MULTISPECIES: allophanate hydrolase subunit 1 [unclassified Mycolicibacterium]MUL47872.1 allophanate hydrolase subunit 1 [Mycolicibacterium sp. CBMA 360]MUL59280.1 allophanate hydrolase subunit 1 [Mycolicibacterium sp. CBMA 335]MUL71005.1 allophanate hydrolase subunit 1 [Mycolicibacterium sp. CBMA 311]MUL94648.1 allophanate hydrolase subunit 1 [Mycolicibacterium sp. CBMA 230]MUM09174.1 allophanate hydrolase [Mycolicibacterium sp. CBMA 213]
MTVTLENVDAAMLGAVRDYGDQALLLELNTTAEVVAWTDTLRTAALPGVLDIVPASRTILVKLAAPRYCIPTEQRLSKLRLKEIENDEASTPQQADVVINVVYDGTDLDEVAGLTGLAPSEVIAAHTGSLWRVAFGGFTPGFAYLVGGDERLQVPRRTEPRTRVPAGSVALAGEFSGVYPRETPGGWQLIGRTDVTLWDIQREQPALLIPGMSVQFRAIG